jgi:hypothetical protein
VTARGILAVSFGPQMGTKAVVSPGTTLTIGSDERAGLRLLDEALAPVHLEVAWDGQRGRVTHRGGRALSMLDGRPFASAEVVHGQWIRAGGSDLTFHVEAFTPPAEAREPGIAAAASRALRELRARSGLYAVLDVAADPRILELVSEACEPWAPLFDGLEAARLADAAPRLFALSGDSRLLADLVREGWGERWGVFLTSSREPAVVRRHLRQFLLANVPGEADPVYFRFYDPDVLRVVLTTSTDDERRKWFDGVVDAFIGEDPAGAGGWWALRG